MNQTIIDCHIHVNGYESLKNLSLKERIDALLDTMHTNNVDHAIILSSYIINEQRPSTSEILAVIKKNDNLHVVAGFSISNHDESIIEEYRQHLKKMVKSRV